MHQYHLCLEVLVPDTTTTRGSSPSNTVQATHSAPFPKDIFSTQLLPTYRVGAVITEESRSPEKTGSKKKKQKKKKKASSDPGHPGSDGSVRSSAGNGSSPAGPSKELQKPHRRPTDWRVGPLEIEWFDMTDENEGKENGADSAALSDDQPTRPGSEDADATTARASESRRSRTRSARKKQKAHTTPTSGAFIPFRCGKTELNAGILHLYRDREEVGDVLARSDIQIATQGSESGPSDEEMADAKGSGTILCVLAVPTYMTAQDFLAFVGPMREDMAHLRIVRDSLPNRYMVLVKFRSAEAADDFHRQYNGRQYSSMEPEVCHVVYLKSIEFKSHAIPPYAFPPLPDDPSSLFLPSRAATSAGDGLTISPTDPTTPQPADAAAPVHVDPPPGLHLPEDRTAQSPPPPPNQLLELPTCPVCLDRMDASVSGLLTIVCHHTFHCHCLSKWGDSSCPVCRYSSKFGSSAADMDDDDDARNECMECGAVENLWICLICGNIGCGRYQEGHAQSHFADTSHLYAMELETQRVWDYAGDGYVHRLIQNRTDGKLVELPAPSRAHSGELGDGGAGGPGGMATHYFRNGGSGGTGGTGGGGGGGQYHDSSGPGNHGTYRDGVVDHHGLGGTEKLESLGLEYTYLLTSQLESQRLWYESRLTQQELSAVDASSALADQVESTTRDLEAARSEVQDLTQRLAASDRDLRILNARVQKLADRAERTDALLREEKAVTASLLANQASYQRTIADQIKERKERDDEVSELREQVRDLMTFLDMRGKIEEAGGVGEVAGASVVGVAAAPEPPVTPGRKKGKGRR
ncbi:hypothetical protein HKX48_003587 [Thoreauomyces humboldtii]|nr:hypothetical protein HKX48_003587 [Thoreauomyces humboldtii]